MKLENPVLIGVYIVSITSVASAIANFFTAWLSGRLKAQENNKSWLRKELRDIYADSIKNLATILTLSSIESNLDSIENSIIESKKYLALSLIYGRCRSQETDRDFSRDVNLFVSGQYEHLLKLAKENGVEPCEKYCVLKDVYGAADVMLRRVLEVASQDKRLY